MSSKNFTEADAVRHIIDRDRGEQNAKKPKIKPLMQSEKCEMNSLGQWKLTKDNSVKPFGQNIYNSTANLNRKRTRTGQQIDGVGRNKNVRQYTTPNASVQAAREANEQKEQNKKTKASTKTFATMSPEEKQAMIDKYSKKD
jgi:hypothetical protein